MTGSTIRRLVGASLASSLTVLSWAACLSGPMTMSDMACCAEHHEDCAMAGTAESCCGRDDRSEIPALAIARDDLSPEASSSFQPLQSHPQPASPHTLLLALGDPLVGRALAAGSRPRVSSAVLRI